MVSELNRAADQKIDDEGDEQFRPLVSGFQSLQERATVRIASKRPKAS
jgi:predicted DNA binding CopG/RHH family protein